MNLKKTFTPQLVSDKGFIGLISVLIFAGVVIAMITGVTIRSLEEGKMGLNQELSHNSLSLADACAEHVISQLGANLKYDGENSVVVEEGKSCEVVSTEKDGSQAIVKTKSDFEDHTSRVKVIITKSGSDLQVEDWQEVSEF